MTLHGVRLVNGSQIDKLKKFGLISSKYLTRTQLSKFYDGAGICNSKSSSSHIR